MSRAALLPTLALTGALLAATNAAASDPPHWTSPSGLTNIDCTAQCHTPHQATGGALTPNELNVHLCQSCHRAGGGADALPVDTADLARPLLGLGRHHAFDVAAASALYGTLEPVEPQMALRVMGGNVVCSTCHDQHAAVAALGGTPRVGATRRTTSLGSTGSVASGGTFSGAEGVWYLVRITVGGNQSSARFGYSKDGGASWFPTNCVPGGVTTGCLTAGAAVALDLGVTLAFATGSFVAGEQWELSASWPFLRAALDQGANGAGDAFCRDCHRGWTMDSDAVGSWDGAVKSHPVGVALPAADGDFHPVPLDGSGQPQGGPGGDANPTNDLRLDALGNLQCLTCHSVHYADDNTLSVDRP